MGQHPISHPCEKSDRKSYPYVKDSADWIEDYFTFNKEKCNLYQVTNWLNLFTNMHNKVDLKVVKPYFLLLLLLLQ